MEFQSTFGGKIEPAKFLVEMMCKRKALKDKVPFLPKFWQEERWKGFYAQQIVAAHSLLKLYKPEVIVRALNNQKATWMYSLRSPQLQPFLIEEQNKLNTSLKQQEIKQEEAKLESKPLDMSETNIGHRKVYGKKNTIAKLKELDE